MAVLCEQCTFWEIEENNPEWGVCKRNAPSPSVRPDGGGNIGAFSDRSIWPYVRNQDGCGQGVYRIQKVPKSEDQTIPPSPQDLFQTKVADAQKITQDDKFNNLVEMARNRIN
jgi:hypothetical protein